MGAFVIRAARIGLHCCGQDISGAGNNSLPVGPALRILIPYSTESPEVDAIVEKGGAGMAFSSCVLTWMVRSRSACRWR